MNNIIFWLLCLTSVVVFILSAYSALVPFMLAFIFSYLLQPLVLIMTRYLHFNRLIAVLLAIAFFILILCLVMSLTIPIIFDQTYSFISKMPLYKNYVEVHVMPTIETKLSNLDPEISDKIKELVSNAFNNTFSFLVNMFSNIWSYTITTLDIVATIILLPIISFYLLKDWHRIILIAKQLMPEHYRDTIVGLIKQIDQLLGAYVRGQLNICLMLALFYAVSLHIIGLEFAFLMGIISGFLIIIPFVGTSISALTSLIIGYYTYTDNIYLLYIVGIYALGHIIEIYLLVPKVIGKNIGLNPAWILFALMYGGSIVGFIGVLLAIPIAGIVKVLLEFSISIYKQSSIYIKNK